MDVRDAWGTYDAMMPHTTAFPESASTRWTSQSHGLAKAVSPECREIITGTTTFPVSASGPQPDLEVGVLALALILVQGADEPRQIQLPVCPAPQKQVNLEQVMRKPQRLTPMWKAATRRKHEAQTGSLAPGALGVPPALVLRMQQTGATLMWVACYAPYTVAKKPPYAESFARLTCGGGTHLPQPCGARLSSVVCARQSST